MSTTVLCPQQTVLGFPWKYCPYGCSPLAIDSHEKAHAAVYGIPSTCQPPLTINPPCFAFALLTNVSISTQIRVVNAWFDSPHSPQIRLLVISIPLLFLPMKSLQWRRATHTTERPFFLELRFIHSLYTSGIQTDAFSQMSRASWWW